MSNNIHPLSEEQTAHKYTFQLELIKLYCTLPFACEVKLIWARGGQQIQNQNPIHTLPNQSEIPLSQTYCNKSTVLYNVKTKEFKKKQSKIVMKVIAKNAQKSVGQYVLNLCEILDNYSIKNSQTKEYRVKLNTDKLPSELVFRLTAEYWQQMTMDKDHRSIGSGVASISSKGAGMLSGQKNYVQKKNLFLYQPPSKDNQSVTSYTSYNPGMGRYASNNKKQSKEDTASVRREDYGIPKRQTVTDFFSKTTNMKSNISQQYDGKSRQGSYNRLTHNDNKFDNKTQNFDQTTNKQLLDEQAKRSKLEAEVSKLNIYQKQQSDRLNEYIKENTRLKQQVNRAGNDQAKFNQSTKQQFLDTIEKLKRQNNDLHNRAYELNNQNRDMHRNYDIVVNERERLQQELQRVQLERSRAENKLDSMNRNLEGVVSNKEHFAKKIQDLNDQLEHIRSLNSNLRENLEKQRKKNEQFEHQNRYQISSMEQAYKQKQQRANELDRDYNSLLNQLKDRQAQLNGKKQVLYRLERTNQEYKSKIMNNQSEKKSLLQENIYVKSQMEKLRKEMTYLNQDLLKIRDEKSAQYEHKNTQLESQNYQNQQKIRSLEYQVQQHHKNYNQISLLNDTLKKDMDDRKTQIYRLQSNIKSLKDYQSKYLGLERQISEKQRQLGYAKEQNNKLIYRVSEIEDKNRSLLKQLQETKGKIKQNSHSDVDVNQILRESVQMQVQLKFKSDELLRLKNIEDQYQECKYQLDVQKKDKYDAQEELQRIQKQLKDKNKMYLIEVEKGKMTDREKVNVERQLQSSKVEIKRCQQIIYNGDRQVKQMESHIVNLESDSKNQAEKLRQTQRQLQSVRIQAADTSKSETKIKELESQLREKVQMVNLLTNSISSSQKQTRQLQAQVRYKDEELNNKVKSNQNALVKLAQVEETKAVLSSQLQKILNQRKGLELKNQTIMQQMHGLKKKFQDEKGRSTSFLSGKSSQQQVKIRQLQNQLQKKEKTISKLTKEKLEIEQENINLHVQVMKKLSEMEKSKVNSQGSLTSTQKIILTPGSEASTK